MEITEFILDAAMDASDQAWSREEGRFTSWRQMDAAWRRTARDAMKAALEAAVAASSDLSLANAADSDGADPDVEEDESNVFYAFPGARSAGMVC